jgi:RHS repeat-associated protein
VVSGFSVLTLVLLASTQSASASELGLKPVSLSGPLAFVRSLFASAPSLPGQGRGRGAGESSTKAGRGSGSAPKPGAGQLPADTQQAKKATAGKSATVYKGFDAKTSTRLASRSTVDTTWWQNADGSLTERLSQGPANYRDASGAWQPIDPSLVRGSDGRLHQRANGFGLSFAGGTGVSGASAALTAAGAGAVRAAAVAQNASSTGQLVDVSLGGGGAVAWSLAGANQVTPSVSADGTTTTYPGILAGTTLQLTSENYGVKESLLLSSAAAGNTWTFPLALTGVSLSQSSAGVWQLVDTSGNVVATLPLPEAWDSNVDPHSGLAATTTNVTYALSTVAGVEQLTMTLDPAWLADPARVFPVTVDPTVYVSIDGQKLSTYVDGGNEDKPNTNYLNYSGETGFLKIGNDNTNDFDQSFLEYPSGVAGTGYNISAAQFAVYDQHQWNSSTSYGYTVYAVGAPWSPSTITWNNRPGVQGSPLGTWTGSSNNKACGPTTSGGRWEYTNLDAGAMNNFAARGYQWFGLTLTTPNNSTDSNYWKVFDSSQVSGCSPYVQLTYNPDVPPQVDSMSPLDGTPVSTLTPQLTATGHDPDNYPNSSVSYHFAVFPSTGGASIADSGSTYQSSGMWSVPAGKLAWGKTYQWTVDVFDGYTTETTRTYNTFTTTAPPPVLTGGLSQSSDGHGFDASLGNYTTSATDADVAGVGPTLSVVRDYNSLDSRSSGAFGASWSSMLDAKATQVLDASGNLVEVVVTYPDGSQVVYAANADGSFSPPAGRYATFTAVKNSSGVLTGYTLTDKDGTTYTFEQTLTPASLTGTSGAVAGVYGISSIADRLGRALNFTYDTQTIIIGHIGPRPFNVVTTVTSSVSGRALHMGWGVPSGGSFPHVMTVTTDDATNGDATSAQLWTYQYQNTAAPDELTGVCAPSRSQASVSESACTQYTYSGLSDYQNGVLDGDPSSYWPLSDAGSSASASSRSAIQGGTDTATYTSVGSDGAHLAGSTATTAKFSGNGYVTLPSALITNKTYMSVALWFKTTSSSTGTLFSTGYSTPTDSTVSSWAVPVLYVGSDGYLHGHFWDGTVPGVASSGKVNDGNWHFVVLSAQGNTQQLYLDGALQGSLSNSVMNAYPDAFVGAGLYNSLGWPAAPSGTVWNYFNGSISDVAVYTRGLTSTEAGGLYTLGNSAGAFLTKITRPSAASDATKAPAAQVSYDSATGRVTSVTDANGATWGLSAPVSAGSSQPFRAAVLAQAPQDYWRLGDSAGTTNPVNDINTDAWVSTAGVSTYNNTTLGVPGVFAGDSAASFDGSSSYVQLPTGVLNGTPQTVGLWFKTTSTSQVLLGAASGPLNASSWPGFDAPLYIGSDGELRAEAWTGDAYTPMSSPNAVNDGAWHYAVLTIAAGSQTLYLDGKNVATKSGTVSMGNSSVTLGAGWLGGTWPDNKAAGATPVVQYFAGSLAHVAVFRSTLSDAQVSELWQGYHNALVSVSPVTKITVTDPADTLTGTAHTEAYYYDPLHSNRLVRHDDALGGQTVYGYDTSGFLNTVTDPNGDQTITGHDVRGNEVSHTTCRYEAQNQCQTSYYTYFPDDTTAVLSYPLDPRDDQEETASDARSSSSTDTTYRTSYGLDPATGLQTSVTTPPVPGSPSGRTTTTAYTDGTTAYLCNGQNVVAPKGLVQKVTTPGGATTTTSYYADGDTCQITDADGLVTRFTYDGLGRVLTKTVVSDTYPSGLTTSYAYDGLGHVASSTAPTVTEYVITANHNHTAVTTSAYDVDGNLTSQTVSDSTGGDAPRTVYYSYNAYDQKATSSDARSASASDTTYQTMYTYDLFGNVETKTDPLERATKYLYDADNRLVKTQALNTAADTTASAGSTLTLETRSYDPGGRLASVVDAQGYTTNYLYYDDNLTYQVSKTDGTNTYITEQDSYDAAGNLTKKLTNNLVTETDDTIDAAGRTTTTVLDPSGVDRTSTTTYSADDYVSSSTTSAASGSSTTAYTYDAMGNTLTSTVQGVSGGAPAAWWQLNQTTGTTVTDASGNGNTATLNAAAGWTSSGAATFNGTSSAISTNGPVANTTSSFSVSAWANLASTATWGDVASQQAGAASGFELQYDLADKAWSFTRDNTDTNGSTATFAHAATTPATGTWYHLVGVFDASSGAMTLYVNGTAAASATDSTPYNSFGPVTIGAGRYNSSLTSFFNGQIANVQIYPRALSASDVATLDANGQHGNALSATGATTTWSRDQRGLATSMTDPDGNTTRYTYDRAGRLAQTITPTVGATSVNGTTGAAATSSTLAITSTGYDTFGEATETQDALGNETINTYDAAGNQTSTTAPAYTPPGTTSPITAQTTYKYDADSELTTLYDPVANQASNPTPTAQYTYTNLGLKHSATDASGNVTTYAYDSDTDPVKTTVTTPSDSTGVTTSATYDYLGRTQTSTQVERHPSSATYTTQYNYADPAGLLTSTKLPSGNTPVSYAYDNIGETTQTTDASNNKTTYGYDYAGRLAKTTLPDNSYSTTSYDALGDATGTATHGNSGNQLSTTSASYDADGRETSSTNALGATDTFVHDATGLLTSETQPTCTVSPQTLTCPYTAITVSYGYDLAGHQTAYTNGNGNTTYTSYNSWDLPETTIEPPATPSTYTALSDRTTTDTYDADGHLATQTQPGSVTTSYAYNPTGTLAQETGSGAAAATATRAFTYNAFGDITQASTSNTSATSTSNATSESLTYDDRGDLLTTSGSAGSSSFTYNGDRLMASQQDVASTSATGYTYDTQDRLQTLNDPLTGTTATYTYTDTSQPNTITYGSGGDVRTFGYDNLHRPTSDTLTSAGTTVASIGYAYNANGDLTSKTTSSAFTNPATNTYTYDLADRLTSWENGTTTAYAYDQDSNRTQVGANVYTYDQRDELTSDGTNSYTYTARGTMTAKTNTSSGTTLIAYTDDAYNQQTAAATATYTYDAAGRMLTQTSGAATTTLQYSGAGNLVASDGTTGYTRDPGGALFSDAPAFTGTGGTLDWTDLHTDVVGSFTPTATGLAGSTAYDPLGNVLGTSGHQTSLGYQSEWTDTATGQINMAARWYNPATGQFTNKDTVSNPATPDTANANPFGYANANPLTGTDPSGNCPADKCGVPGQPDTGGECNVAHNCDLSGATGSGGGGGGGGGGGSSGSGSTVNSYTIAVLQAILNIQLPVDGKANAHGGCVNASWTDLKCDAIEANLGTLRWGTSFLDSAANMSVFNIIGMLTSGKSLYNLNTTGWVDNQAAGLGILPGTSGNRVMHDTQNTLDIASWVLPGIDGAKAAASLPEGAGALARLGAFGKGYIGLSGSGGDTSALRDADAAAAEGSLGSLASTFSDISNDIEKVANDLHSPTDTPVPPPTKAPPPPAAHTPAPTTVAKPPTSAVPEQLAIKAVDPAPAEAVTATTAAPASTEGIVEANANAAARPGDGTLDDSGAPGLSCVTHSFTGFTPVLMANGTTKPIDQIKIGDHIANSVPGQTGTQENTVTNVIVTTTDHDFVNLDIKPLAEGSESTATTEEGPATASKADVTTPGIPILKKAAVGLAAVLAVVSGTTAMQLRPADATSNRTTASQSAGATSSDVTQHDGTLTTTFHHPFYDITQAAFVDAQNLKPGDELQTPTGYAVVTGVRLYHANTVTYDLTIGALHTYFVVAGDTPVLVHNDNGAAGELCSLPVAGQAIVHLDFSDMEAQHALITIRSNAGEVLSTHQFGGPGLPRNGVETFDPATRLNPRTTFNVEIPLPNADGALAYAEVMMDKTAQGTYPAYNLRTQSCVTYCANVLRAGGVEGVPTTPLAAQRWLFEQHG